MSLPCLSNIHRKYLTGTGKAKASIIPSNAAKAEEGYFCCPFSNFHVIAWYIKMQSQNFCVYRF
jgi:hypothetical protein